MEKRVTSAGRDPHPPPLSRRGRGDPYDRARVFGPTPDRKTAMSNVLHLQSSFSPAYTAMPGRIATMTGRFT
jgi:hypothetical protein